MQIHKKDNVRVSLADGHKYALVPIAKGEAVIKYGNPIGRASADIAAGEHVHSHNLVTTLGEDPVYTYAPPGEMPAPIPCERTFLGYVRENGEVGIRNDVWILPTVGCVGKVAERIAALTGAFAFPHPYGCSQLGDDHALTQTVLASLARHPNAGGVLIVGLGCENNHLNAFRAVLGECGPRVRFLNCQDEADELAAGVRIVKELQALCARDERTPVPASRLVVGLKCGGSDGYSGITANPLLGRFTDAHTAAGGSAVLTEVPEMFGAEHLLMARCVSREVFDRTVALIENFKAYYRRHGQVVYENPSPGNRAGGITTLEEKSLGCVQKGGSAPVTDVLDYGDRVTKAGLSLLNGPGNDMVAVTNLAASGAHLILFTTGRGTPLGAPVPTVKVATNCGLAEKHPSWIDFDASGTLRGEALDEVFFDCVLRVASGEETKNERNGYREIAIFKDGVTL